MVLISRGKLIHKPSGTVYYPATLCRTLKQRLLGSRQGGCKPYGIPDFWVHTFGLKTSIDAVFCDEKGRVLKVLTLPPNRISPPVWGTKLVWETPTPILSRHVKVGDTLRWETAILWNVARGQNIEAMDAQFRHASRRIKEAIAKRDREKDSCG